MTGARALITGASGQDGTYLAAELENAGFEVIATTHRQSASVISATGRSYKTVVLDYGDPQSFSVVIRDTQPSVVFNLAAFSSGQGMFEDPSGIAQVNGVAVTMLLEAIRVHCPNARLCQASSSEVFGIPDESPQNERSTVQPRSPYGAAKAYADHMIRIYRTHFGLFACSAILFNHESPHRRLEFVTRKVSHAAAAIKLGRQREVALGSLDARRDWGFAGDYMRAMVLMLQQERPRDYVLATGRTHSVGELCETAFSHIGLDYRDHVRCDAAIVRAQEATQLVGDASRAGAELGWFPSTTFTELVHMMVDEDLNRLINLESP